MNIDWNVLAIAFALTTAAGCALGYVLASADRRRKSRRHPVVVPIGRDHVDITDIGVQMRAVMSADFARRRLMNAAEYRVFHVVETEVAALRQGYRVFAQVCLGELLQSRDENAFRSINSKRVDILIVDKAGWPIVAIEYQGDGHYQGTAAARDAIKKEAFRKAGVRYLEILSVDSDDQVRHRVREQLANAKASFISVSGRARVS